MLTLLLTAALLSAAPSAELPRAPALQQALRAAAAPLGPAAVARPLPPDAPAARAHSARSVAWTAGSARLVRSRPASAGAARTLRGALFSVPGHDVPLRALGSASEGLTPAAAERERFEQTRTQLLTSAGMGVAGLLTSGALRLLGAPMPRLPEVMGLRLAPLQTLPLSLSVQGSLP